MRHLPLLCKVCGQRLELPEPTPDLPLSVEANPPQPEPPIHSNVQSKVSAPIPSVVTVPSFESKEHLVEAEVRENAAILDEKPAFQAETAAKESPLVPQHPTPTPDRGELPKKRVWAKPLSIVVDGVIGLVLLSIGGLLGEVLAEKSTTDVWRDASTAPKFPPIDLLMWLAPPSMLCLMYALLISRQKSLGNWLQRRLEK